MAFVEKLAGFPIRSLTCPSKLIVGTFVMLSGSVLALQDLLLR